MKLLLKEIRACTICQEHLELGPRPILAASPSSKILILGQAPGRKVHDSGIAWKDASGKNLRKWLNVTEEQFYDPSIFAIVPMGFCYPGKGKSGDLPPRPECVEAWHEKLLNLFQNIELTLLIGQYAQAHYLGDGRKNNLTETVRNYSAYAPQFLPLPHPSPRNRFWMMKNKWFEEEIIPHLQSSVQSIIKQN